MKGIVNMDVVLATKNYGKARELEDILNECFNNGGELPRGLNEFEARAIFSSPEGGKSISIVTMSRAGYDIDIEENGKTFEENALIKARCVCKELKMPVIADDSGLEVYALSGRPGIYSARYGGEGLGDDDRTALLLSEMEGCSDRRARFVCAAAFCLPDGRELVCRGELCGLIAPQPRGDSGFGYDPVFEVGDTGKTMAELSQKEKNKISHRACAFGQLAPRFISAVFPCG